MIHINERKTDSYFPKPFLNSKLQQKFAFLVKTVFGKYDSTFPSNSERNFFWDTQNISYFFVRLWDTQWRKATDKSI